MSRRAPRGSALPGIGLAGARAAGAAARMAARHRRRPGRGGVDSISVLRRPRRSSGPSRPTGRVPLPPTVLAPRIVLALRAGVGPTGPAGRGGAPAAGERGTAGAVGAQGAPGVAAGAFATVPTVVVAGARRAAERLRARERRLEWSDVPGAPPVLGAPASPALAQGTQVVRTARARPRPPATVPERTEEPAERGRQARERVAVEVREALAGADVERLADRVIATIDRRILAQRERLGRG